MPLLDLMKTSVKAKDQNGNGYFWLTLKFPRTREAKSRKGNHER
jgi:hypothetical protein